MPRMSNRTSGNTLSVQVVCAKEGCFVFAKSLGKGHNRFNAAFTICNTMFETKWRPSSLRVRSGAAVIVISNASSHWKN